MEFLILFERGPRAAANAPATSGGSRKMTWGELAMFIRRLPPALVRRLQVWHGDTVIYPPCQHNQYEIHQSLAPLLSGAI
jgi:hypothetical protein